jgi:hypothetical protein
MSADGQMLSSLFLAIVDLVKNDIVSAYNGSRNDARLYHEWLGSPTADAAG